MDQLGKYVLEQRDQAPYPPARYLERGKRGTALMISSPRFEGNSVTAFVKEMHFTKVRLDVNGLPVA